MLKSNQFPMDRLRTTEICAATTSQRIVMKILALLMLFLLHTLDWIPYKVANEPIVTVSPLAVYVCTIN